MALIEFVKESLPTPLSKGVAIASWTLATALLFLPEWWPKIGLDPIEQPPLWPRLFAVSTILFLGSSICLALVVRHYRNPPTKKQTIAPNTHLEEIREKILSFLSKNQKQNTKQIAKSLGLSEQLAEFHLQELFSLGYITNLLTIGQPVVWLIDQNGRAYLVKNNLPI